MKFLKHLWIVLLLIPISILSQNDKIDGEYELSLYKKFTFYRGGEALPFRILFPENFDSTKEYPLVVFLHGKGESGNDNEKQLIHGAKLFLDKTNRENFPAIVIFPQCDTNSFWGNVQMITDEQEKMEFYFTEEKNASKSMQLLIEFLDNLKNKYRIKQDQIYVMGLSMGGMGTFELVSRLPKVFAAAVPICGGANTGIVKKLKHTNWWVFHGAKDEVVPYELSENMVNIMKKNKINVRYTLYPNANHNSWDLAFSEPDLLSWMFSQKKKSK